MSKALTQTTGTTKVRSTRAATTSHAAAAATPATSPTTTAAAATSPATPATAPSARTTSPTPDAASTAAATTAAPSPLDRRSARTKRMLREAFGQLVAERGLYGFSVGDLTSRADINRATFYAHYRDMDGLQQSFEDEIIESIAALKPKIQAVKIKDLLAFNLKGTPLPVTVELFERLANHGILLKVLLSKDGDAAFQSRLKDQLGTELVRSILHHKYTQNPSALTEYYIAYYAAATIGLIQQWLKRELLETPEHMARILLSIMMLKPGEPIKLKGDKQ